LIVGLLAAASCAFGARQASAQAPATLHYTFEQDPKKIDWSRIYARAFLSFRTGEVGGTELGEKKDLGFGLLKINEEDWFEIANGSDGSGRSVIRDLGEHSWSDEIAVPVLAPLPELKPGEQRLIKVDASADTHGKWAKTTAIFAKVRAGHVYAVRVVREGADLYALFRVESHEQNESCAITWRIVAAPAAAAAGPGR
jgi:hypothetical protein